MPTAPRDLISFHEVYVERHSGSHWGATDGEARYRVMLDAIRPAAGPVTLLDFGCGLSHLLDFIDSTGRTDITYSGLDISERFITASRLRHPTTTYYLGDVLDDGSVALPAFDYVIMNGIWHTRREHPDTAMFAYLQAIVRRMFAVARVGVAFNVVTKQVDWERADLFHVPLDPLLTFLSREVSRHVVIRHDYGLYEYTVYVYQEPSDLEHADAKRLVAGPESGR